MAAYLTKDEALERLEAYAVDYDEADAITEPDLLAASDELDGSGPFVGARPSEQTREFPREGDEVVPDAILNWVALRAYQVASDDEPPVIMEGAGSVRVQYGEPKTSLTTKRLGGLLKPFQRTHGRVQGQFIPARYPTRGKRYYDLGRRT